MTGADKSCITGILCNKHVCSIATSSQQEPDEEASGAAAKHLGQSPKGQNSPPANRSSPLQKTSPPTTENTKTSSTVPVS